MTSTTNRFIIDKIMDWEQARRTTLGRKSRGQTVVFTNGCFDVLHAGHVYCLKEARRQGDFLVVGLNFDASVGRLKGDGRPVVGQQHRAELLAALDWVDAVVLFEEDTPADLVEAIRPQVIVKGGDYRPEQIAGAARVVADGGRVVIVPLLEGLSTTEILRAAHGREAEGAAFVEKHATTWEQFGVYSNPRAQARDLSAEQPAEPGNFKGPPFALQDAEFLEAADYARRVLAGEVLVHRVRLDVARICNFKCGFCFSTLGRFTTDRLMEQIIPMDMIRDLVAELTRLGVRIVNLYGGGEPSLHPQFRSILQTLAEADITIRIITNGSGLTSALSETIQRCRRRIDLVRVSFPGISAESHKRVSGTDSFDRITVSVAELAHAMKTLTDRTEIGLYVPVTTEFSEKEVASFIEYSEGSGADWLFFREDTRFTGPAEEASAGGPTPRAFPGVRQRVRAAAERRAGLPIYYSTPTAVPSRARICYFQLTDLVLVFDPTTRRLVMVRCEHDIPGGLSDLPREGRYELIEASQLYAACERQLCKFREGKRLTCPRPDYCLAHKRNMACERILDGLGIGPGGNTDRA